MVHQQSETRMSKCVAWLHFKNYLHEKIPNMMPIAI